MTVERFTREEFEAALPVHKTTGEPVWEHLGIISGEHTYAIAVTGTNKRITIRSSVKRSGMSAGTGENSIRLWVQYWYPKAGEWIALGKLDAWTTRVPGWQGRMTEKLQKLWRLAEEDSKGRKATAKPAKPATSQQEPPPEPSTEDPLGFLGKEAEALPVEQDADPSDEDIRQEIIEDLDDHGALPVDDAELDALVEEHKVTLAKVPNAEQLQAITAPIDAAVRVFAPPGAGKTFVNVRRYTYLLENGANPGDILAVTFSKPMADELLTRIVRVNPSVQGTSAERQVCTIHAACYRMLKAGGDRRGVIKFWQLKKFCQELAEDLWPYTDNRPGWKEIMGWVGFVKSQGLTTAEDLEFFVGGCGEYHGMKLHDLRRKLDARMQREGVLTFGDMLLDVEIKLKRDAAFREKWQRQFKWVIVDEGQDTSAQAMRILTELAKPQNQFFIVGDTDQLLYRFAGATPEANLFEGFEERYPEGVLVKMAVNYRSTTEIIAACTRLIQNNYEDGGGPYQQSYLKDAEAREGAPEGDPVSFQMFDRPEQEAQSLVTSLNMAMENGSRKPGDFFVGARTRAQLGYLEGPLTRAKIPFINITGSSFWTSKHVADVVAYTRLAFDPDSSEAFQRIYNVASNWSVYPWGKHRGEYCTHRFLGRAFLGACTDYKSSEPSYRWVQSAVNKKRSFRPGVEDLTSFVQEIQAEMAHADHAGQVIDYVVENCYEKYLRHEEGLTSGDESENGKLEDLATVADVARQFENVEDFLEYVAEAVKAAEAARDKDWGDYVVISTVHRLKGLERPVVYGVGFCEDGQKGLLPHTFSMSPPPQMGILPGSGQGRVEDERCVAFVLASRAMDQVYLSGVRAYRRQVLGVSRFIGEMGL